ncbi:MAG: hypothetical protein PHV11_00330 [Candidatus Bipolaricaulis sp.]|nr:hypothetical protein [Candidatus Bipolaricaulis sp.]
MKKNTDNQTAATQEAKRDDYERWRFINAITTRSLIALATYVVDNYGVFDAHEVFAASEFLSKAV